MPKAKTKKKVRKKTASKVKKTSWLQKKLVLGRPVMKKRQAAIGRGFIQKKFTE
ncbi:hypothetical protein KAR91_31495 [Candidatus Pacearchaeota archaeon]|nr:hypothetical protein [Candidatus Pacearchaeota archaeon]